MLTNLKKLQRTSTADQVGEQLSHKILNGELPPGEPLREVAVAASLGVSRNTVREAMRILAGQGLVRYSLHRGVTVADLTDQDIVEIFRIRRMLELAAVEATLGRPGAEFQTLRQAVDDLKQAVAAGEWEAGVAHDMAFHRALIRFLGSPRLDNFYAQLLSELRIGLALLDRKTEDDAKKNPREHQRLLGLLQAGKQKECTRLLESHLADSERRLRAVLRTRAMHRENA
jgi:DNA-binding GntR family transcriptional regulator